VSISSPPRLHIGQLLAQLTRLFQTDLFDRLAQAGLQDARVPHTHVTAYIKVIMAGLRHPRGMKSGLQLSRGARRWLRIRGPCADADFSLVPVSLYQSLAWEPWPEPRTVALSTRYSIAL